MFPEIILAKGTQLRTVTVQPNFCTKQALGRKGPVAYETLLLDSMRGDATLFNRRDEVEAQWRIITPIEEAWPQQPLSHFPNYAAGSEGPALRPTAEYMIGPRLVPVALCRERSAPPK
jgi:glucose-6-phosphate 1-dehydrogenase